ncbi:hypothetical protein ACFE04_005382 [Oxalis oulophora]
MDSCRASITGFLIWTNCIKRISVKRNVGGSGSEGGTRTAASPRSQSPARANQQSQPSLSRSNSRKAEHSPYRRNPLSEIDPNSLAYPANNNKKVMQSRSARLSRELDINPDSLLNPPPSYTTLLLEDILNFHQKNNNNPSSFSLPACVNKACSIVEAVIGSDDLMEPSFHKYVTVRRGGSELGGEIEEEESSGSNSFVGGASQQWGFSSATWESNSAESTDRRTSRSTTRDDSRTLQMVPQPQLIHGKMSS